MELVFCKVVPLVVVGIHGMVVGTLACTQVHMLAHIQARMALNILAHRMSQVHYYSKILFHLVLARCFLDTRLDRCSYCQNSSSHRGCSNPYFLNILSREALLNIKKATRLRFLVVFSFKDSFLVSVVTWVAAGVIPNVRPWAAAVRTWFWAWSAAWSARRFTAWVAVAAAAC